MHLILVILSHVKSVYEILSFLCVLYLIEKGSDGVGSVRVGEGRLCSYFHMKFKKNIAPHRHLILVENKKKCLQTLEFSLCSVPN